MDSWRALPLYLSFIALIALLAFVAYVLIFGRQRSRGRALDPKLTLVEHFRRQWAGLVPLSDESFFALRMVELVSTSTIKEDYKLRITVERTFSSESPIRITFESDYKFKNMGQSEVTLRIGKKGAARQESFVSDRSLRVFTIDGRPVNGDPQSDEPLTIKVRAGGEHRIHSSEAVFGKIPYVAYLPQSSLVCQKACVCIVSYVDTKICLLVTGQEKSTVCFPRWGDTETKLERCIEVEEAIFPREAIIVTVGLE